MNFESAVEYLKQVEAKRGIHLGLENTRKIIRHLCFQWQSTVFIQVAGTNGKGSTSRFLSSILSRAGFKTGCFTSPHLEDVRERIAVDDCAISHADFAGCLSHVKEAAAYLLSRGIIEHMPTYFEYTFLIALCHFSRVKTGAVILEVGLGGRLDATTTITPNVSVITTISRDHTSILGSKISEIAREKAGIIKPGVPVVCGCRPRRTAYREILATARKHGSKLFPVLSRHSLLEPAGNDAREWIYRTGSSPLNERGEYHFRLSVQGRHQAANAAAAIKTLEVLTLVKPEVNIPIHAVEAGLRNTRVPGRIEIIDGQPPVILDAGHNPESTAALADFLQERHERNLTLIFGVLNDKNYQKMIGLLMPYIGEAILTEPLSERALPPRRMLKYFQTGKKNVRVCPCPADALYTARELRQPILVTGSFYLVGALRKMIQPVSNRIEANPRPGGNHG